MSAHQAGVLSDLSVLVSPDVVLRPSETAVGPVQVPIDEDKLTPEQVREIVRLIQCPRCSKPLVYPVTLPCGRSLCKSCLPETHTRANVSYPATASRLQGFQCPFDDCGKEHALEDCTICVTLNRTIGLFTSELDKGYEAAVLSDVSTGVAVKDAWQEAGVPTLRDVSAAPKLLKGGRLLATYHLALVGELPYHAEVSFEAVLSEQQRDSDVATLSLVKGVVRAEMDCQVCYAMFYEPLTTPCGHTFCRVCLQRVIDHSNHCPVCRRGLSLQPMIYRDACPPNQLLTKITIDFWADNLEERRIAIANEGLYDANGNYDIPVFVCTLSFPSMPTFLHVFEPRYRLMMRRALEGDRTFGMIPYSPSGEVELGTLLRIVNVEFFSDGRSLIETIGISRFRILRTGLMDDYLVANVEKINDISLAEEEEAEAVETRPSGAALPQPVEGNPPSPNASAEAPSVPGTARPTAQDFETMATRDLMLFATDSVQRMRAQSVGWLRSRMLAIYGECPSDPALFPWWFANLLPIREMERYQLLATTSVRERLKMCCRWIVEWEASRWSFLPDCVVS